MSQDKQIYQRADGLELKPTDTPQATVSIELNSSEKKRQLMNRIRPRMATINGTTITTISQLDKDAREVAEREKDLMSLTPNQRATLITRMASSTDGTLRHDVEGYLGRTVDKGRTIEMNLNTTKTLADLDPSQRRKITNTSDVRISQITNVVNPRKKPLDLKYTVPGQTAESLALQPGLVSKKEVAKIVRSTAFKEQQLQEQASDSTFQPESVWKKIETANKIKSSNEAIDAITNEIIAKRVQDELDKKLTLQSSVNISLASILAIVGMLIGVSLIVVIIVLNVINTVDIDMWVTGLVSGISGIIIFISGYEIINMIIGMRNQMKKNKSKMLAMENELLQKKLEDQHRMTQNLRM